MLCNTSFNPSQVLLLNVLDSWMFSIYCWNSVCTVYVKHIIHKVLTIFQCNLEIRQYNDKIIVSEMLVFFFLDCGALPQKEVIFDFPCHNVRA